MTSIAIPTTSADVKALAREVWGDGIIDLSIGNPIGFAHIDIVQAGTRFLSTQKDMYPQTAGIPGFVDAARSWLGRNYSARYEDAAIAPTQSSKHLMATIARLLYQRERRSSMDSHWVIIPELCYSTYEDGLRRLTDGFDLKIFRVPADVYGRMDLSKINREVSMNAICMFVNSPNNPTGAVENMAGIAKWARENDVTIVSDECYQAFHWERTSIDTMLDYGIENVIVAHSFSKSHSVASLRCGFMVGDPELVGYLVGEFRTDGMMPAGPSQAGILELMQSNVVDQTMEYRNSIEAISQVLDAIGLPSTPPIATMYFWLESPDGNGASLATRLARDYGIVGKLGVDFGDSGRAHVRLAAVVERNTILKTVTPRI